MNTLLGIIILSTIEGYANSKPMKNTNSTNSKDMYVINALVYQVGIISNKTSDDQSNQTMGNQEAITFYHTNGSKLDLNKIPTPLVTNVTAQRIMEVAPILQLPENQHVTSGGFSRIDNNSFALWPSENASQIVKGPTEHSKMKRRNICQGRQNHFEERKSTLMEPEHGQTSIAMSKHFVKRDISHNNPIVKVTKGMSTIPLASGLQSIALPPLLILNNNSSKIPVPIPNTSLIQYAKVNAVVKAP